MPTLLGGPSHSLQGIQNLLETDLNNVFYLIKMSVSKWGSYMPHFRPEYVLQPSYKPLKKGAYNGKVDTTLISVL